MLGIKSQFEISLNELMMFEKAVKNEISYKHFRNMGLSDSLWIYKKILLLIKQMPFLFFDVALWNIDFRRQDQLRRNLLSTQYFNQVC